MGEETSITFAGPDAAALLQLDISCSKMFFSKEEEDRIVF